MKGERTQREIGVRLRNERRVKLPLSSVSSHPHANRQAKNHRLPHSYMSWHAWADQNIESGGCVRAALRNRTPYQACERTLYTIFYL